jgi:hypothetical protein
MMLMRRLLGSVTAAAIVLAPTAAVAQQAPAPVETQEMGAQLDDDGEFPYLWVFGGVTIVVILYFLLKGDDDDDDEEELPPTSP